MKPKLIYTLVFIASKPSAPIEACHLIQWSSGCITVIYHSGYSRLCR